MLATSTGEIIDTESYSTTQKDNIVISLNPVDEDCSVLPPIESNTGTTNTGSTNTGTSLTGTIDTGTGNQTPLNPPFTWGLDTTSTGNTDSGSTNTGGTDPGSTSTGVLDNTGATSTGSFVPQDDGSTST